MNGTDVKNWTEVRVTAKHEMLDTVCAVMSMIDSGLMITDYNDIDLAGVYGDLIDESILRADKSVSAVSVFIPAEKNYSDSVAFLRERFASLGVDAKIELIGVNEEDWAESWKKYYKPIKIGEKIVIVPMWEDYEPEEGEIIVKMDPGMAFGTGTHETTRLVIALLEKYIKPGARMLDVGCGSGILSICASKLGAARCAAYDIDPVAVRVAKENIEASGAENIVCGVSDLLRSVDISGGKYDVVAANIVADIIIRLLPDIRAYMNPGARMICSGIITERCGDVLDAVQKYGFEVVEKVEENGWCAIVIK